MKLKDFAKGFWEMELPWWAWAILAILFFTSPFQIHIQL